MPGSRMVPGLRRSLGEGIGNPQWHPTPVLLPRKSHGRRSLVGCSPWGHKELDTTEVTAHTHSVFTFMNFWDVSQRGLNLK